MRLNLKKVALLYAVFGKFLRKVKSQTSKFIINKFKVDKLSGTVITVTFSNAEIYNRNTMKKISSDRIARKFILYKRFKTITIKKNIM